MSDVHKLGESGPPAAQPTSAPRAEPRGAAGRRPFDALRSRLFTQDDGASLEAAPGPLRLDPDRRARTGVPEIVLGGAKRPTEIRDALIGLAEVNGRALASRCDERQLAAVRSDLPEEFRAEIFPDAGAIVVVREDHAGAEIRASGGQVGILTAGSSDAPVAIEARLVAREMGCAVHEALDVGVAGLHRLVAPLERMIASGVDALVVVAGMDGALPSVVAGLVDVPVVGVPTSTGYGMGGKGEAALLSMLQTCAPGLVVVNIDNGIGAGAAAARIANRAARARHLAARDNTEPGGGGDR